MGTLKVLVVEDDRDLSRGLSIRLAAAGYEVVTATDGHAAVDVARREHPDVVLLDIGLPKADGVSVLRRYSEMPAVAATPVVILTGRDPEEAEPAVQEFHVAGFLRKPAPNPQLLEALERALNESIVEGVSGRRPTSHRGPSLMTASRAGSVKDGTPPRSAPETWLG